MPSAVKPKHGYRIITVDYDTFATTRFPDTCSLVTGNEPPFLLFHGTADDQVPHSQSIHLHEALNAHQVPCDLVLVEGANHAGPEFMTESIKERVLTFLDQVLAR